MYFKRQQGFNCNFVFLKELAAIKARVLEMEEESERLKEEEERGDAVEMQHLSSSPQPGKTVADNHTHTVTAQYRSRIWEALAAYV